MIVSKPIILSDKSRLQEIYDLRVEAWEKSENKGFVNRKLFPDGWFDDMDVDGIQLIITNEENTIVASSRLNTYNDFHNFPYYNYLKHLTLPETFPFAYYSRLVVNPAYQGKGLSKVMDSAIIDLCEVNNVRWVMGLSNVRTEFMVNRLGFKIVGSVIVNYNEYSENSEQSVIIKSLKYTN